MVEAAKHRIQGERKCGEATLHGFVARWKVIHNEAVLRLRSAQAVEIDEIQGQFTEILSQLNSSTQSDELSRMKSIEDQIAQVRAEIAGSEESVAGAAAEQPPPDDPNLGHSLPVTPDCPLLAELGATIQARTEERLEALTRSKTRFTNCLLLLEEMECSHNAQVAEARQRLDRVDARYQRELWEMAESEMSAAAAGRDALAKANKNLTALEGALRKLQNGHTESLKTASSDYPVIQQQFGSSAPIALRVVADGGEQKKLRKCQAVVGAMNHALAERERRLAECRLENDSLRRELACVKHGIRFAERSRRFREPANGRQF
jgi:hypothetical protein